MVAFAVTCRYAAAIAVCGILVGCGGSTPAPSPPAKSIGATRPSTTPDSEFAETTESPQPVDESKTDPDARALSASCGESDRALLAVARHLLEQPADATAELDVDAISYALRAAGAPYLWPRAWLFNGSEGKIEPARARMQHWLASFANGGVRRCGVAVLHAPAEHLRVSIVTVDVLADLEPLPTRVRVGQWLEVRATLRVEASDAKLVVMGPRGTPHPVPTSLRNGQVLARFNADQPGTWLIQLLGAVDEGPRTLLEAVLFAGTEPSRAPTPSQAPGEELVPADSEPRAALYALVNAARATERLTVLERDEHLEAVAQAHAEAMRRVRKTAHDVGQGDLNQRLEQFGLEMTAGENIAHAGSATLAQRALWASPSHRGNLLLPGFGLVGIGVAPDPDGTLWVCQVFGNSH